MVGPEGGFEASEIDYASKNGLTNAGFVTIKVFDILGEEISTLISEKQDAGTYDIIFDGSNLVSGIYIYQMKAGSFIETKKMVLVK